MARTTDRTTCSFFRAGLIQSGYCLIHTMSIRGLLLLLTTKLLKNCSDALHHQILVTRSAFLGAVQAASQAPEGQASSSYPQMITLSKGRQAPAQLPPYLHLLSSMWPRGARGFYRHFHLPGVLQGGQRRAPGWSPSLQTLKKLLGRAGCDMVGHPSRSGWRKPLGWLLSGAQGISTTRMPAAAFARADFMPVLFPPCKIPGRPSTLADIQNCHLSARINWEAPVIPHIKMLSRGVSTA